MASTSIKISSALIIAMIVLASCDQSREPVSGSVDRTGKPIEVTVYFYDSEREVTEKYKEVHNLPQSQKIQTRAGFALWPEWRGKSGLPIAKPADDKYDCTIHTVRPYRIDDRHTMTLGHEMLHCLLGTYHPESPH